MLHLKQTGFQNFIDEQISSRIFKDYSGKNFEYLATGKTILSFGEKMLM